MKVTLIGVDLKEKIVSKIGFKENISDLLRLISLTTQSIIIHRKE